MRKRAPIATEEASGLSTVGKAIEVLDLVYEFGRPVRFKELEEACRFPKPTLYRFVQTLTDHGMLAFDPDSNSYFLGLRLVRLAHAAWRQSRIAPVAQPHLRALADRFGEAVYLSKLDGGHCVCLDRGMPSAVVGMSDVVNRVYPSYCTAVGKAMLACLPEDELTHALGQQSYQRMTDTTLTSADALRADLDATRERGYAIENEEHVRGILSVAVPILAPGGSLLGGLGVHAPDRRTNLDALKRWLPEMQDTAGKIAQDAAVWRFPETIQPHEPMGT